MASGTFGFKGFKDRALELPAGVTSAIAVDVSPSGRARLRYNDVAKQLEQSIDGGAYTPLGGTGAGPWDQVGTDVFPDSTGWNVTIGGSAVVGTERLRVVGTDSGLGGIRIEADAAFPSAFLEMNGADGAVVSNANEGRLRYSQGSQRWEVSENGGAYVPISGSSPWTSALGTIHPTNLGDDVAIGVAAMSGSERLRVAGGILQDSGNFEFGAVAVISATSGKAIFGATSPLSGETVRIIGDLGIQGDIDYEAGASREVRIRTAADDTNGNDLTVAAGIGGNYSAGPVGVGGQVIVTAGNGGVDANPGGVGGAGATGNYRGGRGGNATGGGGSTGGAGGAAIFEGGAGGGGDTRGAGGGSTLRGGSGDPGGTAFVQGGPGQAAGNVGGNVFIDGGAGLGAADGSVNLGASNTSAVNIAGGGGVPIAIAGPLDLVGFYGVAPVVQPSTTGTILGHTPGALLPVTEDSTFTGNLGPTAYTIGDIVLAMKQLGLLPL
jgi:hypothetical protein